MRSVLLLSLGFVLTSLPLARAQTKLEWKWKENDSFYVLAQRQVKQKLTIDDPSGDAKKAREINQTYDIVTGIRYRVKSKEMNGNFVLEQAIDGMEIRKSGGVTTPVQSVQGIVLTFQISPKGEVSDVRGYDAMIKKLADQGVERELLKGIFSEQMLKESLQETFSILPPGMQKPGEKWTSKSELQLGSLGKLDMTRSFTQLPDEKKDNRTVARISLTANSAQSFSKDKREVRATGNCYFDAEKGRLTSADLSRTTITASKIKLDKEYNCELEQTETITVQVLDKKPD